MYEVFIALLVAFAFAAIVAVILGTPNRTRETGVRSSSDVDVEQEAAAQGVLSSLGPLFFFFFVVLFLAHPADVCAEGLREF